MALNSLFCADVPLSNYPLTHWAAANWTSAVHGEDCVSTGTTETSTYL